MLIPPLFLPFLPSPQHNANLLQRSEVVALINTLHRFTESLAAVNDFRKMWAEADPDEEAQLIQEAESAVAGASKVGYSPSPSPIHSFIYFSLTNHLI